MEQAQVHVASEIHAFWHFWFKNSNRCRTSIPLSHIVDGIESGSWKILCAWEQGGEKRLVGTIVRRAIGRICVKGVWFEGAGSIDYFCIHGAWRRRGLGRCLLGSIHGLMAATGAGAPIAPHLFLYERSQLLCAPLSWTTLWVRRARPGNLQLPVTRCEGTALEAAIQAAGRSLEIVGSHHGGKETAVYCVKVRKDTSVSVKGVGGGLVWGAVLDLFCVSIPEGYRIGCLQGIWSNSKAVGAEANATEAAEAIVDACGFDLVLVPSCVPRKTDSGWERDETVQWIGYNLNSGLYTESYPVLFL